MNRLFAIFSKRRWERELDEEIESHLRMQFEHNLRLGMPPDEARYAARRSFGAIEPMKEIYRGRRGLPALETLWQDLRYAYRTLRKSPGFTAVALLTLALGIGANTAIFSVIEAVLLRPLAYRDPGRLAILSGPGDSGIFYQDFAAWRLKTRSFQGLAAYCRNSGRVTLTGLGEPEALTAAFVSTDLFHILAVSPVLGRVFTAEEETARERVVVLSHGLWMRRFGGSAGVLGQTLEIDGTPARVVGVMPATFQFPIREAQLWMPLALHWSWENQALTPVDSNHPRSYYARWNALGRLQQGVTIEQAQAELHTIAARLEQADPIPRRGHEVDLTPLRVVVAGNTRLALLVLLGAVAFVLLIACSNVANLALARGATREREMAVRTALGAGRARLVRLVFTESAVLALLAGWAGLALAWFAIPALVAFAPPGIPRLEQTGIDAGVLLFTLAISLFAAITFGLAPALKLARSDPQDTLKAGARGASAAIGLTRARSALVVVEFALAVVLLTGAGLLMRSFLAVEAVDPGFRPQHVLTMSVRSTTGSDAARFAFHDQVLARVRALPGVEAAGGIDTLFEPTPSPLGLRAIEGRNLAESPAQWTELIWKTLSGDCLQALGVPLVRGLYFSAADGPASPLVALIDESMARRYWPAYPLGPDPVGQRIKGQDRRRANDEWVTIIGIVRDMRRHGLDRKPTPHVFEWYRQTTSGEPAWLVVRTTGNPAALSRSLRAAIRALDPKAILSPVTTMEQQLAAQLAPRRFQTWLLGLFSLVALALAGIGIFGVMHYSVAQRTHEIGVRMALGARPGDVQRMVLRQGLWLVLAGLGAGLAAASALTRLLANLLFGVTPSDPVTLAAVSALLAVVALLASWIPARRATQVEPLWALRHE